MNNRRTNEEGHLEFYRVSFFAEDSEFQQFEKEHEELLATNAEEENKEKTEEATQPETKVGKDIKRTILKQTLCGYFS